MTGLDSSLASVTPEKKHITCKNKSTVTPDVSIIRKDPIREKVTTRKIPQGDSLMHSKNQSKKSFRPFQHKVDYEGDTGEYNRNTYDSQLDNDNLVRNLDK